METNREGREFGGDRKTSRPTGGEDREGRWRRQGRRRVCRFCADPKLVLDYKDLPMLHSYVTDRGKLVPRRISGNCAKHQRAVTQAVKRARNIALMPFTVQGE